MKLEEIHRCKVIEVTADPNSGRLKLGMAKCVGAEGDEVFGRGRREQDFGEDLGNYGGGVYGGEVSSGGGGGRGGGGGDPNEWRSKGFSDKGAWMVWRSEERK